MPHKSWDCGLPKGIPLPEDGEAVMELEMQTADDYDLGQTQYGHRRVIVTGTATFMVQESKAICWQEDLIFSLN